MIDVERNEENHPRPLCKPALREAALVRALKRFIFFLVFRVLEPRLEPAVPEASEAAAPAGEALTASSNRFCLGRCSPGAW